MNYFKRTLGSLLLLLLFIACSNSNTSLFPSRISANMLSDDSLLQQVYHVAETQLGDSVSFSSCYRVNVLMNRVVQNYMLKERPYRSPLKIRIPTRVSYVLSEEVCVQHPAKKKNWLLHNTYSSNNSDWIVSSDTVISINGKTTVDDDLFNFHELTLPQLKLAVNNTLTKYSADTTYQDLYVSRIEINKRGIHVTISRTKIGEKKEETKSESYLFKLGKMCLLK